MKRPHQALKFLCFILGTSLASHSYSQARYSTQYPPVEQPWLVKVYEVFPDNPGRDSIMLERYKYNGKGKIVLEQYFSRYNKRDVRRVAHKRLKNQEIIYEYKGDDIKSFIANFEPKVLDQIDDDEAEGTGSPEPPNGKVTKKYFRPDGKLIKEEHYASTGYMTGHLVFHYDSRDSMTASERYDGYGKLYRRGKRIYHSSDSSSLHITNYENGDSTLTVYTEVRNKIVHVAYFKDGKMLNEISYREEKTKQSEDEGPRMEYDENGKLASITYFDDNGQVRNNYVFDYDDKGSWVKITATSRVTYVIEGVETEKMETQYIIREIKYLSDFGR